MSKFKIGDCVVFKDGSGKGVVRSRCGRTYDVVRELLSKYVDETVLEHEPIKVGQRVRITYSPHPVSQFAVNMLGTVSKPELGGTFEVRMDDPNYRLQRHIYACRSMVDLLDTEPWYTGRIEVVPKEPDVHPIVDEMFFLTESGYDCTKYGYPTYDLKFSGPVTGTKATTFRGGSLKLYLNDAASILKNTPNQKYRLTLTPVEEPKFKVGDRVRLKALPKSGDVSDHCYLQSSGVVEVAHGNCIYGVHLDTQTHLMTIHESAIELEPKLESPLPCPFYGYKPEDDGTGLLCTKCRRAATYESTKEARVTSWNRRAK